MANDDNLATRAIAAVYVGPDCDMKSESRPSYCDDVSAKNNVAVVPGSCQKTKAW